MIGLECRIRVIVFGRQKNFGLVQTNKILKYTASTVGNNARRWSVGNSIRFKKSALLEGVSSCQSVISISTRD